MSTVDRSDRQTALCFYSVFIFLMFEAHKRTERHVKKPVKYVDTEQTWKQRKNAIFYVLEAAEYRRNPEK